VVLENLIFIFFVNELHLWHLKRLIFFHCLQQINLKLTVAVSKRNIPSVEVLSKGHQLQIAHRFLFPLIVFLFLIGLSVYVCIYFVFSFLKLFKQLLPIIYFSAAFKLLL
jgi:hypothetical protein